MTAKQKKLFLLTSMMSVFVMAVTVLIAGGKYSSPLSRVFAAQETVTDGTITFNKSDTISSGDVNTTIGKTKYNYGVVCKVTNNNTTYSNGYIGAVTNGSQIHFYESDGATEYFMENLNKLAVTYSCPVSSSNKSPSFHLYGLYADGRTVDISYNASTTNATRTANFTGASYGAVSQLYVEYTSSETFTIESIVITYDCNPKYQTGVEISTAPTKTSYMVGQSFNTSGMVVRATYSNGAKVATDRYTVSPSGSLTIDDTYVTISFNGFSVTQAISVTNAAEHAVGTYRGGYSSNYFYLELYSDGTGVNRNSTGDSSALSWSYDGTTLSFFSAQPYTFIGTLFENRTSCNANSISLNSSNNINTFKVKNVKGTYGSSEVTFTRQ